MTLSCHLLENHYSNKQIHPDHELEQHSLQVLQWSSAQFKQWPWDWEIQKGKQLTHRSPRRCHTDVRKISVPQLSRIWGREGRKERRDLIAVLIHCLKDSPTMKVFYRRPFSGKWESHQLASRDPGETERGRGHQHLLTPAYCMTVLLSHSQPTQHCCCC